MIRGFPKFDGIAVGEGTFSFLGSSPTLEGKAAFVSSTSGDTHGWTANKQWSPLVLAKLAELRQLMEEDLAQRHFDGGGALTQGTGIARTAAAGGGLGEHLNDPTPSV